jgi:hypothetical protein
MRDICAELVRVLKQWGSLFINEGDTYGGSGGAGGRWQTGAKAGEGKWRQPKQAYPKQSLMLIPHRIAIMLVDELGLIVRNDNIWLKPDAGFHPGYLRFGNQHEHVFFCTKSNKPIFYVNTRSMHAQWERPLGINGVEGLDWKWIPHKDCKGARCKNNRCKDGQIPHTLWKTYTHYFNQMLEPLKHPDVKGGHRFGGNKANGYGNPTLTGNEYDATKLEGRNMRDVWIEMTSKFTGGHFACWPPAIAAKIVDACCPREICESCGLPRVRLGKRRWSDCGCGAPMARGVAMDPFFGAGSSGIAAEEKAVDIVGIEINPEYAKLAKERIEGTYVEPGQMTLDAFSALAPTNINRPLTHGGHVQMLRDAGFQVIERRRLAEIHDLLLQEEQRSSTSFVPADHVDTDGFKSLFDFGGVVKP